MSMQTITCIVCPNSCRIRCERTAEGWSFSGNACKRGAAYAQSELTCPMRTLATTVRTRVPQTPVVSVRTRGEIPKASMREAMAALALVVVDAPLHIGDVVVADLLDTGCDVVCTSELYVDAQQPR